MTSTELLHPELWEHVSRAVAGARRAVSEYLSGGGYVPRVQLPTATSFDGGWPNMYASFLGASGDPVDIPAMFAEERDTLHPFAYGDVPELIDLIDFVLSRDEISQQLRAPGQDEWDVRMRRHEAAALALGVLARGEALGVAEENGVRDLYRERERALLADSLPAQLVLPLLLLPLPDDLELALTESARIEAMDGRTQAARTHSGSTIDAVPRALVGAATHALVIDGVSLANRPRFDRVWGRSEPVLPLAEANLLCEALRIALDAPVGYAQVLLRPVGWADRWKHDLPVLSEQAVLRRYPPQFDKYGWLAEREPLQRALLADVPVVAAALKQADKRLRLASRRLAAADLRDDEDDRTIDACIGLEAALGDSTTELSHRLAQRAAALLATSTDRYQAPLIYDWTKKVYNHRSALVHGTARDKLSTITVDGHTYTTESMAIWLLRHVLLERLKRPSESEPGALDTAILESLGHDHDHRDEEG